MQIAPKADLWWDVNHVSQDNLFDSWIEPGDVLRGGNGVGRAGRSEALRALKRSPLALDLYAWLTYTAFVATRNKAPRVVPWEGLYAQMGAEYAELRQFRANVQLALKKIRIVYPGLKLDLSQTTLTVHPSRTAISSKPNISTVRYGETLTHKTFAFQVLYGETLTPLR